MKGRLLYVLLFLKFDSIDYHKRFSEDNARPDEEETETNEDVEDGGIYFY